MLKRHSLLAVSALLALSPAVVSADRFALVIGIDDYQAFGKLKTCRNDAKTLARVLVENAGFPEKRVILLTDDAEEAKGRPTRGTMRRRIAQVTGLSGKGDTVLVFFSGHAITADGQGYLVPSDGDADPGNDVSLAWVKQQLDASAASSKLLILDACHAGSAAKGVASITPSLAARATNTLMLLSCKPEQVSYPKGQHSVFSEFLIDGLSGSADRDGDKSISQLELFGHVKSKMTDWCLETGRTQTPVIHPEPKDPISLARLSRRLSAVPRKPTTENQKPQAVRSVPTGFMLPDSNRDQHGNPVAVREGRKTDPDTGLPWEIWLKEPRMEFVLVPAGEFMMGSRLSPKEVVQKLGLKANEYQFADEHPRHPVRITEPFYLGKYEVTVEQFEAFVEHGGYKTDAERDGWAYAYSGTKWTKVAGVSWLRSAYPQERNHPVVCVSWNDAAAFCRWLNSEGEERCALPTEAEWEYTCRAGTTTLYCWSDDPNDGEGRCNGAGLEFKENNPHIKEWVGFGWRDRFPVTAPVGSLEPNQLGLHDMHGNTWEWCQDWYGKYSGGHAVDPKGPISGKGHVVRGGSWSYGPLHLRAACRLMGANSSRNHRTGFRVLLRDF